MNERLRAALFGGLRLAFRAVPLTEGARDRLRDRFLDRFPGLIPAGPRGNAPGLSAPRRARIHAAQRALGYTPASEETLPSPLPATLIAFYLPQFHTIPENDAWWGRGFTEWTNVSRAVPQFEGHAQPRLPGDLGFYDLRNPQVMRGQAALARQYGIGAFCSYFYWFGGRTLLESPIEQWLGDASIDFPMCLCWANENWSRRWDGRAGEILIAQSHSAEDDIAFIAHVARYLRDPRYLRVDGKPLLLVYRPGLLPDAKATAERWRQWCREHDIGEICLAYVQSFERPDPGQIGFDAGVEFPPNLSTPSNITARQRLINPGYTGQALDWRELSEDYRQRALPPYRLFPAVNCGWDNEPRRPGAGRTYLHASPHAYGHWLQDTITDRLAGAAPHDRLVFINAWNEWAEGAVLEPDARLGHAWLAATRRALQTAADPASQACPPAQRPCVVIHAWYTEQLAELVQTLQDTHADFRLIVTTSEEHADDVRRVLVDRQVHAEVIVMENRGRDILPFLRVAYRLRQEGEQLLLKLHTKRSPHRQDGERWRRELVGSLASTGRFRRIVAAFQQDATLGMVAPEGHVQPLSFYWGANADATHYLATRMGIAAPDEIGDTFISGSMFWTRMDALSPLLDAHLDEWEFEAEENQVDGTFAHAVERVFALGAKHVGLNIETAAAVCGEPSAAAERPYPFAQRR